MESDERLNRRKGKINKISVTDQVFNSIKQDILDGVWKAGDKLPSEAEFAELFGVNRLSVRLALQKLSTLGFIETRVGEGSFVVESFSLKPIFSEIAAFYEDDKKYSEVQQLRNLLEGECMNLAILYASQEEKNELLEALNKYDKLSEEYYNYSDDTQLLNQLVDADFAFHYKIVKMSHNSLYKDIYYMVQQLIHRHILQLLSSRVKNRKKAGLPRLSTEEDTHHKIYEAIIKSDKEALCKAREEMLGIIPADGLDVFSDNVSSKHSN